MDQQTIYSLVVSSIVEVMVDLRSHSFTREDRLQDLGANSVDRAEILMLVIERLNLRIPRIELFGPSNIGELVDLLSRKCAHG